MTALQHIISSDIEPRLRAIAQKVADRQRISFDEGVYLYEHGELGFLGALAKIGRAHV